MTNSCNFWGVGGMSAAQAKRMPPLALAYLGDAVYELYVRHRLLQGPVRPQASLHQQAVQRVRASAQANVLRQWLDMLTEDEAQVVRRGRNTRVQVSPGADTADQHYSTAFEALIGYLYLAGDPERLCQLMEAAFESGAHSATP
jgi:ribonuclease-3 family protein